MEGDLKKETGVKRNWLRWTSCFLGKEKAMFSLCLELQVAEKNDVIGNSV